MYLLDTKLGRFCSMCRMFIIYDNKNITKLDEKSSYTRVNKHFYRFDIYIYI